MKNTCIIIPCYNEEKRLPANEFLTYIRDNTDITFCFVNDGSTDETLKLLQTMQQAFPKNISIVDLPINKGKAEAVRAGVNHILDLNAYDYTGYFDADLATPLTEIKILLHRFANPGICMVFGSRVKLLSSVIERTGSRHYIGRVFATLASNALNASIYDTQCGAKIFRSGLAKDLFQTPFITKWLFDVELFARIIQMHGHDYLNHAVIEAPLSCWLEKGDSKVKLINGLLIPFHLYKIKKKYGL